MSARVLQPLRWEDLRICSAALTEARPRHEEVNGYIQSILVLHFSELEKGKKG